MTSTATLDERIRQKARVEWCAKVNDAFTALEALLQANHISEFTLSLPSDYGFQIVDRDGKKVVVARLGNLRSYFAKACLEGGNSRAEDRAVSDFMARIEKAQADIQELHYAIGNTP